MHASGLHPVCTRLIYNPPRKQNCKSHLQIFPIEVLVTCGHAMNSQEQAGLPQPRLPHTPGSWTRPWGPGHPWVGSEVFLATSYVASSAMGVATNLGRPGPAHQKRWFLSDLVPGEPHEAQVTQPSPAGPPHCQPSRSGPHCSSGGQQSPLAPAGLRRTATNIY